MSKVVISPIEFYFYKTAFNETYFLVLVFNTKMLFLANTIKSSEDVMQLKFISFLFYSSILERSLKH